MAQPFRVLDGDTPGNDLGGWDEGGNVDLPGILTVDTIRGSGSSTPALNTVQITSMVQFVAAVSFIATSVDLTAAASGDDVLTARVDGDTDPQLVVNANGRLEFGSGSAPVDVALFRDGSSRLHTINDFVTEGDLVLDVAGKGINIKEGANGRSGAAVLVAGSVVVSTTEVTATSRIYLTSQVDGGTPGVLRVSARPAATSCTISSSNGSDTSTVAWLIIEPA